MVCAQRSPPTTLNESLLLRAVQWQLQRVTTSFGAHLHHSYTHTRTCVLFACITTRKRLNLRCSDLVLERRVYFLFTGIEINKVVSLSYLFILSQIQTTFANS